MQREPTEPSNQLPLEQREQIDRLADKFESESSAGRKPRIEDYLEEAPELREPFLRELLALEVELRRAAGDRPDPTEYQQRFPNERYLIAEVCEAPNMSDQDRIERILAEYQQAVDAADAAVSAVAAKRKSLIDSNPDLAEKLAKLFAKRLLRE